MKMKKTTFAAALSIVLFAASCGNRERAAEKPAVATAPAPAAPAVSAPLPDGRTLAERLTAEAESRPAGALRAEAVAAALQNAGVGVRPLKQVLASAIGARFCMAAPAESGLGVAVCEFASDAEAARGLAYSRQTFDRLIPNRNLLRNHATVLTLTRPADSQLLDEQSTRAAQAFAAL
ncbi:MAG TPA: hypothetical protein VMU50_13730 [Polyangia bacterium]|nr:hypothetical protein [Polyangia bacterium]